MKRKYSFISIMLLLFVLSGFDTQAQNAPKTQKKLWAKSFIGKKAPAIEVEGWIQEPSTMNGKYILVDIWATWCGPCRKIIPEMNQWQTEFADKLVIIGISNETKEKVEPFAKTNIKYANGYDTQARVKNALKVTGIPHVILIDPKGIVIWEGFPKLPNYELTTDVLKELLK